MKRVVTQQAGARGRLRRVEAVGSLTLLLGLALIVFVGVCGGAGWACSLWGAIGNWHYGVFVLLLIGLSALWPAEYGWAGRGILEDGAWFVLSGVFSVVVLSVVLAGVAWFWQHALSGFNLGVERYLGFWGAALFALMLTDLLGWLVHRAHHKWRWLWFFHAVHHSQERMNALSDNRTHIVENMIGGTVILLPSLLLGLGTGAGVRLAFLGIYVSAFIHSNIKTNLGWLGYIFISPQAHRVHHSSKEEHYDSNYGTIFSFWDVLAGTFHPSRDIYPETGIVDSDFPREARATSAGIAWLCLRQTLYPFKQIGRELKREETTAADMLDREPVGGAGVSSESVSARVMRFRRELIEKTEALVPA